jgi:hypothetical protein
MGVEAIETDFREKVCSELRLAAEGTRRYRVLTPFMFPDGDHLAVVLKNEEVGWVLSDEGHTYMHLTYDLEERDLREGTRQKIISNALSVFGVQDLEGELRMPIPEERFGDALFSYVQALLKISDVTFLTRERVRSTFLEDFRRALSQAVPEERLEFDWHDPARDPEGNYPVDCRINSMPRPLMIFALPSDDRTSTATITLWRFETWGLPFRSLAVFEDQENINRKVLARFSDVSDKQFSSLAGNQDRIEHYLAEVTAKGD